MADSPVSLDSQAIHDGTIRIMEFRFENDGAMRIEAHRNVAGDGTARFEPISPARSFCEKLHWSTLSGA